MVYKRYIKRGNKLCGPYYYESYRDKNGNVISRYLPDYSPETNLGNAVRKLKRILANKTYVFTLWTILAIIILLALGNLNYYSQNQKTTGKAVNEILVNELDRQIAEQLSDNELVSNVDVRTQVEVEVKQSLFQNKIIEFNTSEGKINLEFDLLDYASWVENNAENTEVADNFDINVNESAEKYKWGYKVKLNSLDFMAKINVKADNISVIDNQTLKIGNNYLSFADLTKQGYIVRVENPVVLEEMNLTEINISEINITEINQTLTNITITNETIVSNVTSPDINESVSSNESYLNMNESAEEINESLVDEENNITDIVVEVNITGSEEVPIPECSAIGCINNPGETGEVAITEGVEGGVENVEQPIAGAGSETLGLEGQITSETQGVQEELASQTLIGNVIKTITGFIINGVKGITGFFINTWITLTGLVVGNNEQIVSIYIQKDFEKYNLDNANLTLNDNSSLADNINNTNNLVGGQTMSYEDLDNSKDVSIGDIINLDPELIVIMTAGDNGTATDGNIVYQCGTINQLGSYVMNQSITNNSLTGPCINITAQNITLNCQGHYILSDDNYAGVYSNQINTTIKNCNISMG
ncbi:MAG: hypothetical protein AABW67_01530, partial [Nanoarchaeota archaeon]